MHIIYQIKFKVALHCLPLATGLALSLPPPFFFFFWLNKTTQKPQNPFAFFLGSPLYLFQVLYTGKGKWKVGVVGVSILQNRPDPSGGFKREGSESWVRGSQSRLAKREWRRPRVRVTVSLPPRAHDSLLLCGSVCRLGRSLTASCWSPRLSELRTEPSM